MSVTIEFFFFFKLSFYLKSLTFVFNTGCLCFCSQGAMQSLMSGHWNCMVWPHISTLPSACYVTFNKWLILLSQPSNMCDGNSNNPHLLRLFWRWSELIHIKLLYQYLLSSKCYLAFCYYSDVDDNHDNDLIIKHSYKPYDCETNAYI